MTNLNHYLVPRIHIGDIDSDGYPDILVTLRYNNGSSIPHILLNSPMPKNPDDKKGLQDEELDKTDKDTKMLKHAKNRYFSLNFTSNPYHQVL